MFRSRRLHDRRRSLFGCRAGRCAGIHCLLLLRRRRPANVEARVEAVTVASAGSSVRPVPQQDGEAEVVVARDFADAQLLADHLRVRRAVVLDLRDTEPDTVRRLVDFASGITYALDGTMQKVAQGVILVAPARTTLSDDEVRRLAELGLYQLDA